MAHSLPILYELHWLPVKERINFKIAVLCYKSLNDEAPVYISNFLTPYIPKRALRSSSDTTKLVTPYAFSYKFYGGRSFSHVGPLVWNALPRKIREAESTEKFKSMLKHYLFTTTFF